MFVVTNRDGDEISGQWRTLEQAIADAREFLENDPELQELLVWSVAELDTHVRTITFAPNEKWETVIVDLAPGERITLPPGAIEPDEGAYPIESPKHPSHHAVYADLHDTRDDL